MSLGHCIPDLVATGKLTPAQGAVAADLYQETVADLKKVMGLDAAEALASTRTVEAIEYQAARSKRNALKQVAAQRGIDQWLTGGGERWGRGARGGGPGGPDGPVPGEGDIGPINPRAARTLLILVDARRKAIRGEAHGQIRQLLAEHRRTVTGQLRNKAQMDDIGREAFGEASGNLAAKELAGSVLDVGEMLRKRANAAGADIGRLENRGFAQYHDSRKVAEAGFDAWFAAEAGVDGKGGRLDRARIVDEETGQPFTDAGFRRAMEGVFDTIASDGATKRAAGSAGRVSFANKLGQHRFLHYKSYDDWKASQAQFGGGTAFDALMGEIEGMSRAVAAMEILGPNPEQGIRYIIDRVTGDPELFKPGRLRQRDAADKNAKLVQRLWDEYSGALRQSDSRAMALSFSAYRNIAAASKLGSSPITALSDIGFGTATRYFNGLPIAGIARDYLAQFNPADAADRMLAAELGFVAETWTSTASGASRLLAEEMSDEVTSRIADGVLRVAGLNAVTDAGRGAHGLVTFLHITRERGKPWAELEPAWRAALGRYRIGPDRWDALRATPLDDSGRGALIKPEAIADQELRNRVLEMVHNEVDFAVPVPDLETRAYLNANIRKGNFLGEMLRSSPLMFKTFTIATMIRHGGRMLDQPGIAGKVPQAIALLVPLTVMGVIATQLYEIANGRDPRPMEDPALWGQGLLKSGGLGIVGDIAGLTAQDRYMGMAEWAAGPLIGDAGRIASAGRGMAMGDDKALWQMLKTVRSNIPGQNVWYARLGADRLLADRVQEQIDPNYRRSWRAMERRAADQGQEFYWEPGETSPDRAPDLAAMADRAPE